MVSKTRSYFPGRSASRANKGDKTKAEESETQSSGGVPPQPQAQVDQSIPAPVVTVVETPPPQQQPSQPQQPSPPPPAHVAVEPVKVEPPQLSVSPPYQSQKSPPVDAPFSITMPPAVLERARKQQGNSSFYLRIRSPELRWNVCKAFFLSLASLIKAVRLLLAAILGGVLVSISLLLFIVLALQVDAYCFLRHLYLARTSHPWPFHLTSTHCLLVDSCCGSSLLCCCSAASRRAPPHGH